MLLLLLLLHSTANTERHYGVTSGKCKAVTVLVVVGIATRQAFARYSQPGGTCVSAKQHKLIILSR
jgi:hypothetical protein